ALTTSLLDLMCELEARGISLTVGGGFGLFLKRQHIATTRKRTLFDQFPEQRSTSDLDLFFRAEVIADLDRYKKVAEVIHHLGYRPVPGAEFLQWKREVLVGDVPQEVKIDIAVGPLGKYREKPHTKKLPRVRPKEGSGLHAYDVEEAIGIEDEPIA